MTLTASQQTVALGLLTAAAELDLTDNLRQKAAVILIETGLVESNLTIYANPNVPASMAIPHEAVGTDHASVGPLQQQVPSWGTAADCMDPHRAGLKFLHGAGGNPGLLTLPPYRFQMVGYPHATSWTELPTGSAAQAVQVSAYPDRYQQQETAAQQIVAQLWPQVLEDDMTPAQFVALLKDPAVRGEMHAVVLEAVRGEFDFTYPGQTKPVLGTVDGIMRQELRPVLAELAALRAQITKG